MPAAGRGDVKHQHAAPITLIIESFMMDALNDRPAGSDNPLDFAGDCLPSITGITF